MPPCSDNKHRRGSILPELRGAAIFLGIFCLANAIGDIFIPRFDATIWLIDIRLLTPALQWLLVSAGGLCLLRIGLVSRAPESWVLRFCLAGCLGLAGVATVNAATFYYLFALGRVHTAVALPISLLTAGILGALAFSLIQPAKKGNRRWGRTRLLAAFAVTAIAFSLSQMFLFGWTDYRRQADAVVVFGARAHEDGTCSLALSDRVHTAVELYNQGLVEKLIFSGGPGAGQTHETEAMTRLAVSLGVDPADIICDRQGLSTSATVANTPELQERYGLETLLAVSQHYHLPRIKLAYARAGLDVYTVPARQTRPLTRLPFYMAREVAAHTAYFFSQPTSR